MVIKKFMSYSDMAKALECSPYKVNDELNRLGLQTQEKKEGKGYFAPTKKGESRGARLMDGKFGPYTTYPRDILDELEHLRAKKPEVELLTEIRDLLKEMLRYYQQ